MIGSAMTLAASPIFGSVLKIVAGAVAGMGERRAEAKKQEHERYLERSEEGRKVLLAQATLGSEKPEHVKLAMRTRRHIGLVLTYTICAVAIIWALYPDVERPLVGLRVRDGLVCSRTVAVLRPPRRRAAPRTRCPAQQPPASCVGALLSSPSFWSQLREHL